MGYLDRLCYNLPATVVENPCASSRTFDHADRSISPLPGPGARKRVLQHSAKADLDLEPYSSDTLRPLTAACVFRDCSLRKQCLPPERRACRKLMREAAIKWRRGLAMGDL